MTWYYVSTQCVQLALYATLGRWYLLCGMPACVVPVWFYAWSERQMFIPQGVYSHTYAYTPGYTLFIAAYTVHAYKNIIQSTSLYTIHTHTHTHTHTCPVLLWNCRKMLTHTHTHTLTYVHICTRTSTHTHTNMHTHTHTCRAYTTHHTHSIHHNRWIGTFHNNLFNHFHLYCSKETKLDSQGTLSDLINDLTSRCINQTPTISTR